MNGLRRIILLLSVALAAVIARAVIDGPKLLGVLTGALIAVLLLCACPQAPRNSTPDRRLVRDRCALILFGTVAIFVSIAHTNLLYAIAGLVIAGGFTMFDFNRLSRSSIASAVPIAASIRA
jgi:hypothetical protein